MPETPSSADQAAAALRASVAINHGQQVLTEESRLLLADLLEERVRIGVAEGISAAMTEQAAEMFWSKGLEVMQRQAKAKAGGFLLEGALAAGKKALWIGAFLLLVYGIGGWTLLKTVWAAIAPKG
jgi:hypothetical protein